MITHYHRPQTLEEALALLAQPDTWPLGGGTVLVPRSREQDFAVVDLQALGLNTITVRGKQMEIGATVTLQTLLEAPQTPAALQQALRLEAPLNLRNAATVAGALVACDGRSPLATALLALDALLLLEPGAEQVRLGDLLPLRQERLAQRLITAVRLPLNARLAWEYVARTPADRPLVQVAVAQWPSGRTRVVVGGWGDAPRLAMDGPDATGAETAARSACAEATDPWASADYRREVAAVLARRALQSLRPTPPPS